MNGWDGESRDGVRRLAACLMTLGVTIGPVSGATLEPFAVNARLKEPADSAAAARAIHAAARRLGSPRCQRLLTDFTDVSGRPLRAALDAEGCTAAGFLGRLSFHEGSEHYCRGRRLAYTTPGSRFVFICSPQFRKMSQHNSAYVEAAIIHEALHALGLGENPPTSAEITARVLDSCRH